MSSALQTIGSTAGMPLSVSAVPFAQPAAGIGTWTPPSPITEEVFVICVAWPRQDFDVVDALATDATAPAPAVTLAVLEAPVDVWQLASSLMLALLSAAPTPSPSSDARAMAK